MAREGVQIEGLNRVVRDLQRFGVEVADLKEAFSSIAAEGSRLAASMAPRRSGRLAATIRGNRAKNKAVVIAGKARVPYAGAINYGWPRRNIKASLFMQRADAALAPRAVGMLEEGLGRAIGRAGLE